jgi:hypothetical protein
VWSAGSLLETKWGWERAEARGAASLRGTFEQPGVFPAFRCPSSYLSGSSPAQWKALAALAYIVSSGIEVC